ncbi:hypothetical protein QAD02_006449 [Eretmocerus hayati]|uniref:Uncharacterized protein n=1 Tax=Eretmocerus hayati TaxID=131215 RepID=A0ACC2N115_9HYME|nr:hypothetical protein QAD02_006449 [Eretmocerus hayati]
MSGLNLIRDYSSDSDDDCEKTDVKNGVAITHKSEKVKLPLPQSIMMLKGVTHHEEVFDDPTEHSGRVRSFKHERGNWASLVYIDYTPCEDMLLWLQNATAHVGETGNLFEEFHISLTRTLVLKYHWIDSFAEAVRNIVDGYQCFTLELCGIKIYCNEEKTRTFMGITVQSLSKSLQSLTKSLDTLLEEYQLPLFYEVNTIFSKLISSRNPSPVLEVSICGI